MNYLEMIATLDQLTSPQTEKYETPNICVDCGGLTEIFCMLCWRYRCFSHQHKHEKKLIGQLNQKGVSQHG